MKTILSLFVVLLFVAGCGGGSEESVTIIDPDDLPDMVCAEVGSVPEGKYPAGLTDIFIESLGLSMSLDSDGTYCSEAEVEPQEEQETEPQDVTVCGEWAWVKDRCLCFNISETVYCVVSQGECESCFDE